MNKNLTQREESTPNDEQYSPIDVVYTWVDGNDPKLNALRRKYMGLDTEESGDDIGGATRYANLGELYWSVASINRFMPWVRKIFIVTDGQDPMPQLQGISENFEHPIPIEIVDHKTVFKGFEDILPVFNCNSIETMLWRIPGLSDRYIYFNDDMFVMAPMSPGEWFDEDGRLIMHGHKMNLRWAALLDRLRMKNGKHILGFKTPIIAAANALQSNHILYYYHTPLSQSRTLLEDFFKGKDDLIRKNITPKFRDKIQFSTHSLCNLLAEKAGKLVVRKENTNLFLKPTADRPDYLTTRLKKAADRTDLKVGCISSLDKGSEEQREEFENWINQHLGLKSPTDNHNG